MAVAFTPSGASVRRFDGEACRAALWFPAPKIIATRIVGAVDGDTARRMYAAIDEQWAREGPQTDGFLDLGDLEEIRFEARTVALRWNLAHRAYRQRLFLLVRSQAVLRATRVFSLAFPDMMHVHGDRAGFESEYALVVKQRVARARTSHATVRG
jgi:hypothetical protein